MRNQRKLSIVISYVTLFLSSFFAILFTPFLISKLGTAEYGLYQLVSSFAGSLVILNFGIGAIVTRNIIYYNEKKDKEGQENFLAHAFLITVILSIITLGIGALLYNYIDKLYANSLTIEEIVLAKKLFILMIINIAISFFENAFSGVLIAYEKFAVTTSFRLIKMILRIVILTLLLLAGFKSIAIVITDLLLNIILILIEAFYSFKKLNIQVRYYYFDKKMLWTVFSFSTAIFLQGIISQVNLNLDRVILGVYTDTTIVALYSIALVFFTMFSSITSVVGGVFLPQATKMISRNASKEELTNFVIKPGRIQFMIGGAALSGFILFGENFIKLWVGESFLGAYLPTILLIIPLIITSVQSVIISILDAMLKRMGRSIILLIITILNLVLTLILVPWIGYIGAAIGTSLSLIIGNIVLMNIYYHRLIGLEIVRMFKEIFKGTLKSLIIVSTIFLPISFKLEDSFIKFIIKACLFMIVYFILLYKISFNEYEKNLFLKPINKISEKTRRN